MRKLALFSAILLGFFLAVSCGDDEPNKPNPDNEKLGYYFNGNFFELKVSKENKSSLFIITSKKNAPARKAELERLKQKNSISDFYFSNETQFYVFGGNYTPKREDYYSFLYTLEAVNSTITVLPRIIIGIEKGYPIENLIANFKGKLELENVDRKNVAILKCNVRNSTEVLRLIKKLDFEVAAQQGLRWCEPEMLGGFQFFD